MKKWNNPEIMELSLKDTEHIALHGTNTDGTYLSDDGTITYPTYSGPFDPEEWANAPH